MQLVIENCLSRVLKSSVTIVGCGRTDSHVHASQYFFHTDLSADLNIEVSSELLFRINKTLPDDIAVFDILPVEEKHHARLSAIDRTYTYFIHHTKDPFLNLTSSLYAGELNYEKMKMAADLLAAFQDYKFFHRPASRPKTTLCNVSNASLFIDETGERIKFTITANRFLSGMVRIITYRLIQVGRNKISVEQFGNYLRGTETPPNIKSAYPQGLYLSKVKYPFLDLPSKSNFNKIFDADITWTAV